MNFTLKPLSHIFGAEVTGIDLSTLPDADTQAALNEAWVKNAVLVIRNQHLSPPQFAAAAGMFGDLMEQQLEESVWDEQMNVNVKSAFLTCKHVLPIMERQGGGSVVNISSIAGLRYVGKPQVAYAAGKAALMQMTQTTAVIYAPKGIRLNSVVPGLVFTPLVKRLADKYAKGDFEGFVAQRHNAVPMGHMGDAWDVAHAVLFLASDESKYITAQQIVVDGGITAATR